MTQLRLASLSHDMKTPLNAIALYNDRLRMMKPDDPERHACHAVIADQIDRLVQIARSVLENHAASERYGEVDIVALLRDTASIYQELHPGYTFRLHAKTELPSIWGDGPALGRVLTNLLDNAVNYSQPTQIVIAAELQSSGMQLRVRDRGYGIPSKYLPHIFKPHFRGDSTVPGNGMGLSIAQEIVHAHGGRIEVASTVGVGTVIRIILPQNIFLDSK